MAARVSATYLRDYAEGQECQIRIPGICNRDDATVVLCHPRNSRIAGTGLKAPDILGAWGCSACHAEVDRRTTFIPEDEARMHFFEGRENTQYILICRGILVYVRE